MAIASKKSIEKYDKELNGLHGGAKNTFKQVAEHIILIGKCGTCGGNLIYADNSDKVNLFNYYCMPNDNGDCCKERFSRDVRFPWNKDLFFGNNNPLITVMQIQKDINQYIIEEDEMNQKMSPITFKEFE